MRSARNVGNIMKAPWRKNRRADVAGVQDAAAAASPDDVTPSKRESNLFGVGGARDLPSLVRDFAQWRNMGDHAVAVLRECVDDMWLDELMLGCETELLSCIRQAAIDVQRGLEPREVIQRTTVAVEGADALALKSLSSRFDARDGVALQGGVEAMRARIRRRLASLTSSVSPYISQLSDKGLVDNVKRVMEEQLQAAQEEFESTNKMKTAKAEVMVELQDECSKKDWLSRQLGTAVDVLESSTLRIAAVHEDVVSFFVETIRSSSEDIPMQRRAIDCLQTLRSWGSAAAAALAALGDCGVTSVSEDEKAGEAAPTPAHVEVPIRAQASTQRSSVATADPTTIGVYPATGGGVPLDAVDGTGAARNALSATERCAVEGDDVRCHFLVGGAEVDLSAKLLEAAPGDIRPITEERPLASLGSDTKACVQLPDSELELKWAPDFKDSGELSADVFEPGPDAAGGGPHGLRTT